MKTENEGNEIMVVRKLKQRGRPIIDWIGFLPYVVHSTVLLYTLK